MKAIDIYKSKFDYINEAKVLLKIGYVFAKLKNLNSLERTEQRLLEISGNLKNYEEMSSSLKIRKYIEFDMVKKANKLIKDKINNSNGINKQYYRSLYVKINNYIESKELSALKNWYDANNQIKSSINDIQSPEALIFVYKTIAGYAKAKKNKKLFYSSIANCEVVLNYFELTEFSNSISRLKTSF